MRHTANADSVSVTATVDLPGDLRAAVEHAAAGVIRERCEAVVDDARPRLPVRTGRLRSSVHIEPLPDGATVASDVEYADRAHRRGASVPAWDELIEAPLRRQADEIADATGEAVARATDRGR